MAKSVPWRVTLGAILGVALQGAEPIDRDEPAPGAAAVEGSESQMGIPYDKH